MHKGFVPLFILLCCCTSSPTEPLACEAGVYEHHVWKTGDSWTYLAIPPGHSDRPAGTWVFEVMGSEEVDGKELVVMEKRFGWENQTAFFIREYRDPDTLGLYRREVVNPVLNKTEYIEVFRDPAGSIHYPLYVGKTWEDYAVYERWKPDIPKDEYSVEGFLSTTVTISGVEDITTPAGTFETFVMELEDVEDGEGSFSGTIYFAPKIGKYVKLTGGRFDQVLGNYSIG